jgi:hypothetical protein
MPLDADDSRVSEARERLDFAADRRNVAIADPLERLQRHRTAGRALAREIDYAHAAAPENACNLIGSNERGQDPRWNAALSLVDDSLMLSQTRPPKGATERLCSRS